MMSLRSLVLAAGLAVCGAVAAHAQPISNFQFLGQQLIPTGTQFNSTTVGGLSGLAYDPSTNTYTAISDDRSQFNPARFYNLSINVAPGSVSTTFNSVSTLLRPDGTAYPALSLDPEGIALAPNGNFFVSSEGEATAARQTNPFINEYTPSGQFVRSLPVNSRFNPVFSDNTFTNQISGVRNNLAFESLTITPDASSLFTATENALVQDGPASSTSIGSPSRITRYNLATGLVSGEFLYNVAPVAAAPTPVGSFATNGLVELLALDNRYLVALERSFSTGVGNACSLYLIDLENASDISALNSIAGVPGLVPVQRSLLLDLSTLGITLDNLEALALGPTLPNGQQTFIILSDNNFASTQVTQVLAFSVTIPTPGAASMMILAGAFAARRRRA